MSRIGLRQIRKPNTKGAAFVTDTFAVSTLIEAEKRITNTVLDPFPPATKNDKRITERITSKCVNGLQTDHKEITNPRLETLRGLEARLLQFIFQECRTAGDLLSPPLTLERVSTQLQIHKNAANTVIFRLVEKRVLAREGSATGRGGFTRFRLEKSLYHALLLRETDYKEITNGSQTDYKEASKRITERITNLSSSSSFIDPQNFKPTTTSEPELLKTDTVQLSPEWQMVDRSGLVEIGFTETHLVQVVRQGKLSAQEVQDSIYFFTFDLKRNGKGMAIHGSPLNFFMGILRKGIPYAPPENYVTPEDEARRTIREFKELKERERQVEEARIIELEFADWKRGLSSEQILAIVPEFAKRPGQMQESSLRAYFDDQIWPERALDLLGLTKIDRTEIGKQIDQALEGAVQ